MSTEIKTDTAATEGCAAVTGYVVAATLTRATQEGYSTRTETKLLLWMGHAHSEDEAVGAAVRQMMGQSPGFTLQMHVVNTNPHTAKAEALSLSEVDPPAAGSATVAQDSRI